MDSRIVLLRHNAETLREAVLARSVGKIESSRVELRPADTIWSGRHWVPLWSMGSDPKVLLRACWDNEQAREFLSRLPLMQRVYPERDIELCDCLQDLADILALEFAAAFSDALYPGVRGVEVPLATIEALGPAMEREMRREWERENTLIRSGFVRSGFLISHEQNPPPPRLDDLPFERRQAFAERRRWWFKAFGITPENYPQVDTKALGLQGSFSLWDVRELPLADTPLARLYGRQLPS